MACYVVYIPTVRMARLADTSGPMVEPHSPSWRTHSSCTQHYHPIHINNTKLACRGTEATAATPRSRAAVTALVAYFWLVLYLMAGPCTGYDTGAEASVPAYLIHLGLVVGLVLLAACSVTGAGR